MACWGIPGYTPGMSHAAFELPRDIATLHALITAQAAELAAAREGLKAKALEVEKLKMQLARLRWGDARSGL